MSARADFEAAIKENPNDSLLWLVFADWLEENDEAELAQSIRQFEAFKAALVPIGKAFERVASAFAESMRKVVEAMQPAIRQIAIAFERAAMSLPTVQNILLAPGEHVILGDRFGGVRVQSMDRAPDRRSGKFVIY